MFTASRVSWLPIPGGNNWFRFGAYSAYMNKDLLCPWLLSWQNTCLVTGRSAFDSLYCASKLNKKGNLINLLALPSNRLIWVLFLEHTLRMSFTKFPYEYRWCHVVIFYGNYYFGTENYSGLSQVCLTTEIIEENVNNLVIERA